MTGDDISLGGSSCAAVVIDRLSELVLPGAENFVDLLALLDEEEGRHRLDLVFSGNFLLNKETALVRRYRARASVRELLVHRAHLQLVNVHLEEDNVRYLLGEFSKNRGNDAARTTPGGSEVDDHLGCKKVDKCPKLAAV